MEIVQLLVSPVHRFQGRPSDGVPELPREELVATAQVRKGLGIVGDRYFNRPAHRSASVTLMAAERLPQAVSGEADLCLTRRNVPGRRPPSPRRPRRGPSLSSGQYALVGPAGTGSGAGSAAVPAVVEAAGPPPRSIIAARAGVCPAAVGRCGGGADRRDVQVV